MLIIFFIEKHVQGLCPKWPYLPSGTTKWFQKSPLFLHKNDIVLNFKRVRNLVLVRVAYGKREAKLWWITFTNKRLEGHTGSYKRGYEGPY